MSTERHVRARVLVVEDEPTIGEVVCRYLERGGYAARAVSDGLAALEAAGEQRPDLVVLDVVLPGMDGLEVMRRLLDPEPHRPAIILLTARGEESERITGLRLGADDYVVKPFSPAELVARVDAVLRRVDTVVEAEPAMRFGSLEIDPAGRRALLDGTELPLTQREFALLAFLGRHAGRAFSREELIEQVWHFAFYTDTSTVTVHVRRLRAKLEADPGRPRFIETVRGVGYRFAGTA
jgi:DNA-binding response OmpR family regulator